MKKAHSLKWYRLIGHPLTQSPFHTLACFVESSTPLIVVKHYGGRRSFTSGDGTWFIQFPTKPCEVQCMNESWTPGNIAFERQDGILVDVIPATRYQCECGKTHISEYPYPHMWCQCGKKATPVEQFARHLRPSK